MEQDNFQEQEPPSKSQRKREAHQLQELGVRLTAYGESQLRLLPVSEKIIAAIAEFNRLPNRHGARRRQLQFIGKLMRDCDFEALNEALNKLELGQLGEPGELQQASINWSEKIMQLGDEAINEVLVCSPGLSRQKLRQFYRDIQSAEAAQQEKIRIKLQHYLREFLNS